MKKNIKLIIAYDGTNYQGWQRQINAPTIQQNIVEAIHNMTGHHVNLIGAGRTDSGVHAYGQVAHFHIDTRLKGGQFCSGLNHFLPEDIRIVQAAETHLSFHARYDAVGKTYRYIICNSRQMHPIHRHYKEHISQPLDVPSLKQAATYFLGEHDFSSFQASRSGRVNPIRRIDSFQISKKGDDIIFTIQGPSFLRNMIRIIVGSCILVGLGKRNPECIVEMIQARDRQHAGPTLKPNGLYLMNIQYPDENDDKRFLLV